MVDNTPVLWIVFADIRRTARKAPRRIKFCTVDSVDSVSSFFDKTNCTFKSKKNFPAWYNERGRTFAADLFTKEGTA